MNTVTGVALRDIDAHDPAAVVRAFLGAGADELARLAIEGQGLLADDGVTYRSPVGMEAITRWQLDPIPLVLGRDEWAAIDEGVRQRTELLNLLLADLYGARDLVRAGVLPPELVHAHPGFLRPLDGVRAAGPHQLTISATDLVRDGDGTWRPVSDRTQVPTGVAYALQNRSVLVRLLPELHRSAGVERLAPFVRALRGALRAAAPAGVDEPRMAVLTAGAVDETAFEHAHLAGLLGLPVVEGPDLSVRDGRLWLRSLGGDPAPIDVLLRRVGAWWCDSLELRPDSRLGTPGLVEVVRLGRLGMVNHLGAGVLENAGLQAYLPALSRALLGHELRLAPPRTLWCGDPSQRAEALATLDDAVVKPIARTGPAPTPVHVATLSAVGRASLRARIEAHPHRFVVQERLDGPLDPSVSPDGQLVQGRTVLRTFAVSNGDKYAVLRGGLTRVSDAERLTIATPVGSWSKDTWVLGAAAETRDGYWLQDGPMVTPEAAEAVVSARAVENLLWLGRYAERAEATVRLLRALDDRRTEVTGATPALGETVRRLLLAASAMTRSPGPEAAAPAVADDPDDQLHRLVTDEQRPGTLAFSVRRLVDAAQAVRDQLSGDTWPVVTTLERHVLGRDGARPLLAGHSRGSAAGRQALGPVLTALLALQGLGAESLVRDPSWRFLEAGRRLERGMQIVALLRATVVDLGTASPPVASLLLESVLATAESVITYRRRYRSRAQLATVLELLLRDPDNPRSVRWQLDRLAVTLPELDLPRPDGHPSTTEIAVTAATVALTTADVESLTGSALGRFLDHLDAQLQHAASELARTVFLPVPASRPLVEERTGTAGDTLLA